MKLFMWIILIIGLLYVLFCLIPNIKIAKIALNVMDEDGKPVKEAKIETVFKYGHLSKDAIIGKTDINGYYSVYAKTPDGTVGVRVTKDAYYESILKYYSSNKRFGIWQPWNNQINILLRPVVSPVPMYARNLDWFEVPFIGKEIGYDLIKSDWVKPYGEGNIADFLILAEKRFTSNTDYEGKLTVRFSNPYDGIYLIKEEKSIYKASSSFRLPRKAPVEGYMAKLEKQRYDNRKGFHDDYSDENNYIFRVRSVTDKDGRLIRAMYGKIVGDIGFTPQASSTARIKMQYCLNPDYTQNLEFDPKNNLLKNLPKNEQVRLP